MLWPVQWDLHRPEPDGHRRPRVDVVEAAHTQRAFTKRAATGAVLTATIRAEEESFVGMA